MPHLYFQNFGHSHYKLMGTAGGGKLTLIGVLTSCLSLKTILISLQYSPPCTPSQEQAHFSELSFPDRL